MSSMDRHTDAIISSYTVKCQVYWSQVNLISTVLNHSYNLKALPNKTSKEQRKSCPKPRGINLETEHAKRDPSFGASSGQPYSGIMEGV